MKRYFRVGEKMGGVLLLLFFTGLIACNVRADDKKEKSPAQSYEEHAARAHPDRYPNELTDAQWETAMLQMRVRAPLTARDHRKILQYLQANN